MSNTATAATATKPRVKPRKRGPQPIQDRFEGQENPTATPLSDPITVRFFDENQQAYVNMEARWEQITPDYARYVWNNLNKVNRKVKVKNANKIAKAVATGKFVATGETIIFDSNGDLQNGQHRIYGVCKGGKPIVALVVRGSNPRNFTKIDRGATRGADDCLHIRGVEHADAVARLARRVKQFESTQSKKPSVSRRGATLDNDDVLSFVDARPALVESVKFTRSVSRTSVGLITPTWLAFIHYVTSGQDREMADEFIRLLAGPASDLISSSGNREVISHLRTRLDRLATAKRERRIQVPDSQIVGLALGAWNVFCREGRRPVSKLQAPRKDRSESGKVSFALPANVGRPTDQAKQSVLAFRQQQLLLQAQFGITPKD